MQKNELDIYYDFLLDNAGVSDESLQLITNINGYNKKTLDDVLYCQTGYRSVAQFCDACDIENPLESDEVSESVKSLTNKIIEGANIPSMICEFGSKPSDYNRLGSDEEREKLAAKELRTAIQNLRKAFVDASDAAMNIYFDCNDYFDDKTYPFKKDFSETAWDVDDWCIKTIENIDRRLQ